MTSAGLPAWLVANAPTVAIQPADNTTRQWWPAQALSQHTGNVEKEQGRCNTAASQADEEESLEALTALCVQPDAVAHTTAVVLRDCGTKAVVAALSSPAQDGLQRTCTQDSDSTADLLPMLHIGDIAQRLQSIPHEPGGKHDTSLELHRGTAHLVASEAVAAAALAAAEGEDGYDLPLVSKRKNAILDIMCGRSPTDTVGSPVLGSRQQRVPFFLSSISTANNSGSKAFSPTHVGLGISQSQSPGESGDPSGWVASTSDASLLSILSAPVSAPLAPSAVLPSSGLVSYTSPEVVQQSARVLYVGVFLTSESREVLLSMVPAVHPLLRGDHMTLIYMPSVLQLLQFPLGAEVQLHVLGSAGNTRVQAVFVEAPAWLETSSASAHITISVAVGAQAVEAGQLICDALQEAALASSADWPGAAAAGCGAYQHFDEALPLLGRLGVRLAVPAATAASMGWSGAAAGSSRAAAGEVEVVVYSADELARCGCFEVSREALAAFHSQHGHLLGAQPAQVSLAPGFFSPQSVLPTVPESGPSSTCGIPLSGRLLQPASALSSPAGNSPWLPGLLSGSTPPAVTPAASSPHTAAGAAAFAPAAIAASGACSSPLAQQSPPSGGLAALLAARNSSGSSGAAPQSSPPNGGGLAALLRAAGHNSSSVSPFGPVALSHSAKEQPPVFSLRGPAAADTTAAADASPPDSPRSTSSGDSGSSSSSMDAVQFRSAVHVGDYVAVRPFVPSEGNERLLQGYVREFACDEPFQADGVLAVLTDNTIGYVAIVLESTAPSGSSSAAAAAAAASAAAPHTKQGSPVSCSSNPLTGLSLAYSLDRAGSSGALQGALAQGLMLGTGSADMPVVLDAHGGQQPRRRNARDAERDLQLWREFEALQQQHGEVLCSTILESCNQDFAEAIELIKGQAGAAAATVAAGSGSVTASAAASPPAAAVQVSAADDGLVSQLALSLGLVPEHALQLARLVPDLSAEAVVQALQQHSGDVGMAADALLNDLAPAADADSVGSPTLSSPGIRDAPGSEQHSAKSFMTGRDGSHMAAVLQLQAMVPGLGEDRAGLLLDEHGGDLLKAAEALEAMQARELEARSAAAAAGAAAAAAAVPGSSTRTAPAAVPSPAAGAGAAGGSSLAGMGGLSEADQLAILAAMGELDPTEAPQQQQVDTQQYSHSPPQWQSGSPTRDSPKAAALLPHSPPQAAAVAGPSRFCPPHAAPQPPVRFTQPPPPPPPASRDSLDRLVAKEQADELYKKGTKFNEGANILLTAAQDALNSGDNAAFREHKARADDLRKQARAAIEKAQSISWSANNATSQVWEVDLHGLGVTKAVAKFERQFRSLRGMDHPGGVLFRVIVGRGLHSEGNIPKIKLGILQYMTEQGEAAAAEEGKPWGVTWGVDPTNPGVINVHIPADADEEE